ncbi:MAG: DNA-directed DNA polymerase II small subunit [Candidatus Diapherotrites archaeon]|nr:DNA-directed DNA polymerase II small subunit [Candidatus Diapherotrites archaeon]
MENEIETKIAEFAAAKNLLVEPNAVRLLSKKQNFEEILKELLIQNVFLITEQKVNDFLIKKETKLGEVTQVLVKPRSFVPLASEIDPKYRVMEEYDVTNKNASGGTVKNFLEYFRGKFNFLSSTIKKRTGFEAKPISMLKQTSPNNEIALIGMISKKWISKNGHLVFELEDLEATCVVVFPKTDTHLTESAQKAVLDNVVGVKGKKASDEMIIANEIVFPELPNRAVKAPARDVSVASISDIHVGSKLFLEKEFNQFLEWLNGNVSTQKENERIGKIKYLIITGDNVDGIGVYPDQFDELAIKDIFIQYEAFAELIKKVPEYIEIFIIPGQHDAVRRADPQPAIGKEYTKSLAGYKNVHFIGSPSWVEIEGLKFLLYHGASIHDLTSSVSFLRPDKPEEGMVELLKRRDLMASYGSKQPYVPEKNDYLLVREEPDFYFGGDMHHNGYTQYRGCTVINSGTWQARTAFQIQLGHVPTPGIAVETDLKTRKITENHFYTQGGKKWS